MRPAIFTTFALLFTAQLHGIQVTGQTVFTGGSTMAQGTMTLIGPNFSLEVTKSFFGFASCEPCDTGHLLSLSLDLSSDLAFATGSVDGVFYPFLSLGNSFVTPFQSSFFFFGPSFIVTESLVYTGPGGLQGQLIAYLPNSDICVICGQRDPFGGGLPIPISGEGQATGILVDTGQPDGQGRFELRQIVYQLVPEPSTFLLLGVPLAIGVVRRLFR
jgi:hypothetical protein